MENRYKLGEFSSIWAKRVIEQGGMVFALVGTKRLVLVQWDEDRKSFIAYVALGGLDFKKTDFQIIYVEEQDINRKCHTMIELKNDVKKEDVKMYKYNEKI